MPGSPPACSASRAWDETLPDQLRGDGPPRHDGVGVADGPCDTLLIVGSNDPWTEFYPRPGRPGRSRSTSTAGTSATATPSRSGSPATPAETLDALLPLLDERQRPRRGATRSSERSRQLARPRRASARRCPADPLNPELVVRALSDRAARGRPGQRRRRLGRLLVRPAPPAAARRPGPPVLHAGHDGVRACPTASRPSSPHPDRPVVALVGDGAMQMNGIAELSRSPAVAGLGRPALRRAGAAQRRPRRGHLGAARDRGRPAVRRRARRCPRSPTPAYAELLGLAGIRVDPSRGRRRRLGPRSPPTGRSSSRRSSTRTSAAAAVPGGRGEARQLAAGAGPGGRDGRARPGAARRAGRAGGARRHIPLILSPLCGCNEDVLYQRGSAGPCSRGLPPSRSRSSCMSVLTRPPTASLAPRGASEAPDVDTVREAIRGTTRRTVVRTTVWSVPVVAVAISAPAFAASRTICSTCNGARPVNCTVNVVVGNPVTGPCNCATGWSARRSDPQPRQRLCRQRSGQHAVRQHHLHRDLRRSGWIAHHRRQRARRHPPPLLATLSLLGCNATISGALPGNICVVPVNNLNAGSFGALCIINSGTGAIGGTASAAVTTLKATVNALGRRPGVRHQCASPYSCKPGVRAIARMPTVTVRRGWAASRPQRRLLPVLT